MRHRIFVTGIRPEVLRWTLAYQSLHGAVDLRNRRIHITGSRLLHSAEAQHIPRTPGQTLAPGQSRDANRAMLLAAAAAAGARATDLGIARDSAERVEAALDDALSKGVDILITTGA